MGVGREGRVTCMVGRKQPGSRRSKKAINDIFMELYETISMQIVGMKKKMEDGQVLNDEEVRFLKKGRELLKSFEDVDKDADNKKDMLPEGRLREWIEREWRLREICRDRNLVIESTGYYRCEECGECHIKGRKCFYKEYKKKMQIDQ
jgi:hypothetical protein